MHQKCVVLLMLTNLSRLRSECLVWGRRSTTRSASCCRAAARAAPTRARPRSSSRMRSRPCDRRSESGAHVMPGAALAAPWTLGLACCLLQQVAVPGHAGLLVLRRDGGQRSIVSRVWSIWAAVGATGLPGADRRNGRCVWLQRRWNAGDAPLFCDISSWHVCWCVCQLSPAVIVHSVPAKRQPDGCEGQCGLPVVGFAQFVPPSCVTCTVVMAHGNSF